MTLQSCRFAGLRGRAALTPPSAARALLYGSLRMAADSWGVMGMLWGHFGMCGRWLQCNITTKSRGRSRLWPNGLQKNEEAGYGQEDCR